MRKGYFFDIDDTLYEHDFHEIPASALAAIADLKKQGHLICVATSRSFQELKHLPASFWQMGFDYLISDGGALLMDGNKNVLQKQMIDPDVVKNIAAFCLQHGLCWRYSTDYECFYGSDHEDRRVHNLLMYLYLQAPAKKAYNGEELVNLQVCEMDDGLLDQAQALAKDCICIRYPGELEIHPADCDKSHAMAYILKKEQLDFSVAFGDGNNDISMLKMANIGVAMGNASAGCKEAADVITKACKEDGIYEYLKQSKQIHIEK
jgi:hypothetical protein